MQAGDTARATHPGPHEARSSSFTGNALGAKKRWGGNEGGEFCSQELRPPSHAPAWSPKTRDAGSESLHQTHLVTWFSTFTRGTGRARKSLETKVKCVLQRGCESATWTLQAGRPKGGSCFLARRPPLQKGHGSFGSLTIEPCCREGLCRRQEQRDRGSGHVPGTQRALERPARLAHQPAPAEESKTENQH